ncbi:MAG: hypothetical protein KJ710_07005 [Candidatus Omnitrophica bacterium]|nr:hypothetical protein [Candidatus Omnitrophota bacterium]
MEINDKKCISPWTGLLVIVLVCIVIASAILFNFRDSGSKRRDGYRHRDAVRVNFTAPGASLLQDVQEKIVF